MRLPPALLLLGLVACSRPPAVAATPPPADDAPEAAAAPSTSPPPPTSPPPKDPHLAECERTVSPEELTASATAPFANVLVQLDAQSGAVVNLRPTVGTPFSRVPEFTLLRDGTTIRDTADGVVTGKLGAAEAKAFVDRLGQLGAGKLVSHPGRCVCSSSGASSCVEDADTEILRVVVDGTLRHLFVHGGFWNDADAAKSILDEIRRQKPPGEKPYVPKAATLVFFERPADVGPPVTCTKLPATSAHLFERPDHGYFVWARAVDGKDLAALRPVMGSVRRSAFCLGAQTYEATTYPWLPGMDHRAAIASWQERAATIGSE